jgi:hypothetical protein
MAKSTNSTISAMFGNSSKSHLSSIEPNLVLVNLKVSLDAQYPQFQNHTSKDSCLSWCQIAPGCKQYKPEKIAKSHIWTPGFIASVFRKCWCCRPLCFMSKSPWEVLSSPMTTGQTLEPLVNNRIGKMAQIQKSAVFIGGFCGPLVSFSNGEHGLLKAIDRAVILDTTHKCRQLPAWIGKPGTWHPFTQCKNDNLWCCRGHFRA